MITLSLLDKRMKLLNELGLNGDFLRKKRNEVVYRAKDINPYKIREDCINDFLKFCEGNISGKKRYKLERTRNVLDREYEENDVEKILKDIQPQILRKNEEKVEIIREPDIPFQSKKEEIEDLCLYDLILTMKSSKNMKNRIKRYEDVIKRFRPELYDLPYEKKYDIKLSLDPKEMHRAAKACNTCLGEKDDKKYHKEYAMDPGTLVLVTKNKNGKYEGYVRNFLMEDNKMNIYLGVDTIEIIREDNFLIDKKSVGAHRDVLMLETLATVQLGLDLGVDYVLMRDSRAKFGPRQTFKNKKKAFSLRKLGKEVSWSFGFDGSPNTTIRRYSYVLMENWKS